MSKYQCLKQKFPSLYICDATVVNSAVDQHFSRFGHLCVCQLYCISTAWSIYSSYNICL